MPTNRRQFLATCAAAAAATQLPAAEVPAFELDELTLSELQAGMVSGKFTAKALTEKYLARIEAIDRAGPTLRAVIEINPDAVAIAEGLDKEWKAKNSRGPLHGVPVLIKDNIDTADKMATTAGSLAMVGSKPKKDAPIVEKLRKAGAVILGKANLSEWANFRSTRSTSGWSGRGGLTKNPYALDRNPSGSSSGSGAGPAANLCLFAVGTETDGSIISPANCCGIVGLKPTVGLVSRSGIIPISRTQDTAGPMARTVLDAAILLGVLAGTDPDDPATVDARKYSVGLMKGLDAKGLKGARIGVARKFAGFNEKVDKLFEESLAVMKREGAILIDPAGEKLGGYGPHEITLMLYEFKAGLNEYLAKLGPNFPMKTLADIIAFNKDHEKEEMPFFAQERFLQAEACGPLTDQKYLDAVAKCKQLSRTEGIDAVMDKDKLDAIVAPSGGPAAISDLKNGPQRGGGGGCTSPAAVSGYPHITVPNGFVMGLPVGLSFFGRAWSENMLLRLAFAFEQATKHRKPPKFLATAKEE